MKRAWMVLVAGVAASVALAGCGSVVDPMEQQKMQPQGVAYPDGPYGYSMGEKIANLELVGKTDDNNSGLIDAGDQIKVFRLSDYYNNKQYKVLFIGVAAQWCVPCREEQPGLKQLFSDNGGRGGKVAFLEAMIEKNDGSPADETTVDQWATSFQIPFDMAADPSVALGPYYAQAAFPMQLVIDLHDMSIQYQGNGTDASLESTLQGVFDGIIAKNP